MFIRQIRQRYRYSVILLRQLVKTDFKLRYQGSVLGYVWSLLKPLLMFVILYVVFTNFLKIGNDIPHKPVYLFLGIILWNFFTEVTSGCVGSILGKRDLIRKINFPKYTIIMAISFSGLINLCLNFVILGVFMVVNQVSLSWQALLILPLLLELYIVAVALGFLLSALFVKFRDISYIWELLLQIGFYATPIFYPLTSKLSSHTVRTLLLANPMAQILQDARYVLVTHSSYTISNEHNGNIAWWLLPIGIVIILFVCGAWYFRASSKNFAEEA